MAAGRPAVAAGGPTTAVESAAAAPSGSLSPAGSLAGQVSSVADLDTVVADMAGASGDVVGAADGLADGTLGAPVEAPIDGVALARSLLPTAPLPAIEYDLPVVQVERSVENHSPNMETMDWATLQIVETHDDEGRIEIISENQMCELLGIFDEGTSNIPRQGCDRGMDEQDNVYDLGQDIDGAAIPTNDDVPVGAHLAKVSIGRMRILRMKGLMEGGHKKKGSKEGKFTNEGEREDGCENDAAPTNAKGKKMIRGPMTCKRCGEKGHRQASVKCPLNGTAKKRKRSQPRKNVKKAPPEPCTPHSPTREEILRDSPGRVTRSKLVMLLAEGTSSQIHDDTTSPVETTTATAPPKKMTPKRKLAIV
ncbi:hypothetical protein SORBI_3004G139800 [Sorghum bicolor]|uniref:Uncharacterized protein n=1 Tax=Sorghum bicolor TaxID=4558 RepID=C5Y129_SORBI|nr:hypothetical protein SORBI_3004G139800 [Sorghum bicolor]